jgi:Na+-driven multidrug efflux pump
VTTVVLSGFLGSLFRMPPDFLPTARVLFLMVGKAVAVGFPAGVFSGILEGLNRFYFGNVTNLGATLLRAALIVLALHYRYGLLTVALITVTLPLMGAVFRAVIALRVLPIRFGWKYADPAPSAR